MDRTRYRGLCAIERSAYWAAIFDQHGRHRPPHRLMDSEPEIERSDAALLHRRGEGRSSSRILHRA
jgi:hypothetical protein